jgi:hypothetical protein
MRTFIQKIKNRRWLWFQFQFGSYKLPQILVAAYNSVNNNIYYLFLKTELGFIKEALLCLLPHQAKLGWQALPSGTW